MSCRGNGVRLFICVLAIWVCLILCIASRVASFDMALLGVCGLDIYERL